jgi:hypothetical protein
MTTRKKNLAKIAVFCGFILFSIIIGSNWELNPSMPTRVGDDPYSVSIKQLDLYATQLEGQPITMMGIARSLQVNITSGDVQFTITDDFYGLSEHILFPGWAPGGQQPAGTAITNGSVVVIKGTCKVHSAGIIEGMDAHVLLPDNVYLVSISGLVVIGIMLFVLFRLDIKRLRFTAKNVGSNSKKQEGK